MKRFSVMLLVLFLCAGLALAESGEVPAADPFAAVTPAMMAVTDADVNEDGTLAVHTGSRLMAAGMNFGDGAAILRLIASAPAEGRLTIRVYVDDPEGAPFITCVFSPITKESRMTKAIDGVHDLTFVFEGEGTFTSWQAFTSLEALETALRAEHSAPFDDAIPTRYLVRCAQEGTVEALDYTAHDYSNDGEAYEKRAFVYLPYGYDPGQTYDLLILCHGIGGNEHEWGLSSDSSRVKAIMDNLIYTGEIKPFIVVTPNGRGGRTSDASAFYDFGKELRNDLLPAVAAKYAVDITDRSRCAMAGLSMGGMQTINIGIGECLDLFSAYGAFSAAPNNGAYGTAAVLNAHPEYDIRMFYNICGTEDSLVGAASAMKVLPSLTDRLDDSNFVLQLVPGGHDFGVWYLGFYNFARMIGAQ